MTIQLHVDTKEPLPGRDDYEWVRGRAEVSVDPDHPANARVVDLALVPRGDDGQVTFEADVRLLQPVGGGNGRLLSYVPNRGMVMGVPFSVDVPAALTVAEPPHPGDGFLLDRGWTVVWVGWQWDVQNGIGVRAPVVDVGPGWMRAEWRPDAASDVLALSDSAMFNFADHPTADVADPEAVLTVRTSPDGARTTLPRDTWHFPDPSHVALDGGVMPFHWYELVYRTAHCPVSGVGLVAMRDVVAHVGRDFDHVFAYGVSQSGRFLRQLLWEGMNVDPDGTQVFDGVLAHIASSRRGEFNHRYASPSYTHVIGFSNLPPFATTELLARQRSLGGVPKLMEVNSAWEYWRGDGALVHVDPVTGDDLPDDPTARAYMLAGHDHISSLDFKRSLPGANPAHSLDPQPVLRALMTALDEWVVDGIEPPSSRVPRRADGTAVERDAVLAHFDHVPHPDPAVLNVTRRIDLGPDAERRHRALAVARGRAVRGAGLRRRRRRQRAQRRAGPRRGRSRRGVRRLEPAPPGRRAARRALRDARQPAPVPTRPPDRRRALHRRSRVRGRGAGRSRRAGGRPAAARARCRPGGRRGRRALPRRGRGSVLTSSPGPPRFTSPSRARHTVRLSSWAQLAEVHPPSTTMVAPLTYDASSDARNAATAAISSG